MPDRPDDRRRAGDRLGPYELIAPIGAGAMGEVWQALDPGLRRYVAIKILPAEFSRDPDRLRRFEHEAQTAGMLNHPNVLTVYAVGQQDATPYLVTELLDGVTLRRRLGGVPLPRGKALEYAEQLVQGLAAAHEKGVVHRDLKPDNIFITRDDRVKILDFGLAKLASPGPQGDAPTQTAAGVALGTPAYMSPEQVRGEPADHRADIFAAGAVLYEMFAGRRPFTGATSVETMAEILRHDPAPIPQVSLDVEQMIRHCLEKDPAARYQSARDLAFQLRLLRQHSSTAAASPALRPRRRAIVTAGVAVALLAAIGATLAWRFMRPAAPEFSFRRLTSDSGLTTDPALSPDGQLVAYASDRAGADNLDIWRQQLSTGEAVALTSDPADESEPAFSPDGSRIAFRSERDGGGIYVVSAFGGQPRLVARQGRRPRFSPDGAHIAYWVRKAPFYIGSVFIVSAAGGSPSPVQPSFTSAMYPVWSADGKRLLMAGARNPNDLGSVGGLDWWIAPVDGGPPIRTGAFDILRRQGVGFQTAMPFIAPVAWAGDEVFFSAASGESTNLWRLLLPAVTGTARGPAVRLTTGTSLETKPFVLDGSRIAFASLTEHLNIWSVPIVANRGSTTGVAVQVTTSAFDAHPTVSADGTKLAFISTRSGNQDVWLKDLKSGRETALVVTPVREEQAEIAADGTRVSYWTVDGNRGTIYQVDVTGGLPEILCDDCGRPWDWSPDASKMLYLITEGRRQPGLSIGVIDVVSRKTTAYIEHPAYSLARARFSPDARWISFLANNSAGHRVVVAPFENGSSPREDRWIRIAEDARAVLEKPRWSPDGKLLYYTSDADGFTCIYARRLQPATKQPIGQPIEVYHSHSARRSLTNVWVGLLEISLSPDKLFFNLGETTGNIWLAERPR